MTKEEYKRLLQSDYWKGYSYSLIKERDFTCEDCGRRFYNERNKLQVHHLVYRDVNPWSYSPDEVVVLCEECHKKRHGIVTEPEPEQNASYTQSPFGESSKDYSFSSDSRTETPFSSRSTSAFNDTTHSPYPIEPEPRSFKFKYVIYGVILFLCIIIGRNLFKSNEPLSKDRPSYENREIAVDETETATMDQQSEDILHVSNPQKVKKTDVPASDSPSAASDVEGNALATENEQPTRTAPSQTGNPISVQNETDEHEKPSRELSTVEILERRTHADVVKQAKRAGVSTEGSTTEILERITHADVVKQAKRAGVSTEGTTTEILERITRKEMEKYNW